MSRPQLARVLLALIVGLLLVSPGQGADERANRENTAAPEHSGRLTISGRAVDGDGRPVVDATVVANAQAQGLECARTDEAGRFQFHGIFGKGVSLHASAPDGALQATLVVAGGAVRTTFASPITLTLIPAVAHDVVIASGDAPVAGAQVVALGIGYLARGETDTEGRARLRLPGDSRLESVAAWHAELGVAGTEDRAGQPPAGQTRLVLRAPAPHNVHLIDEDGVGVGGIEIGAGFLTDDAGWIPAHEIPAARLRSDSEGVARLPWAPRDKMRSIDVRLFDTGWSVEGIDLSSIGRGRSIIDVRRKKPGKPLAGRLSMPQEVSAEGILITASGCAHENHGDVRHTRARRDGSFSLEVSAGLPYVLAVDDLEWAADAQAAMVLQREPADGRELQIATYPATPVSIRITRGPQREPVVGAWIHVSSSRKVEWIDGSGAQQSRLAKIESWLRTDSGGIARGGLSRGRVRVRLNVGNWNEAQTISINSYEPVDVEFHRAWVGNRRVTGRMTVDGEPFRPSGSFVARGWIHQGGREHLEPVVRPDGTFEVAFDAEEARLLFVDRKQQRSAFVPVDTGDTVIEAPMQPTASWSARLLDEDSQPMAGRTLRLFVADSNEELVPPKETDADGRFRFLSLPSGVPLKLSLGRPGAQFQNRIADEYRVFQAGEVRQDDAVRPSRTTSGFPVREPPISFAGRVEQICRDARLNGMRGLAVLLGNDSRQVAGVARQVLQEDSKGDILAYVALSVEAKQVEAEAATIAGFGWPRPAVGEILLVALGDDQTPLATLRVPVNDEAAARKLTAGFLAQHRPPRRDAVELLGEARKEAAASDRRVWIVIGGSRCGPCYRLARWLDDHGAALAKDYVIVKLMSDLDGRVAEVLDALPRKEQEQGIPWYAITDFEGEVLVTSDGPLGNIAMAASDEDLRHLRHMLDTTARRLTAEVRDALIRSLSPER